MNNYNNGDKVYTFGDIEKLEAENAALRAQVEQLRKLGLIAIRKFSKADMYTIELEKLDNAYAATPAQCLAEIKAQAFEDFFSQVRYMEGLSKPDICEAASIWIKELRQQSQEQK